MRLLIGIVLATGISFAALMASAQPPGGKKDGPQTGGDVEAFVARMMAFDTNKDGKLTRDEITDERLLALFDRADANKDGVVTRDELVALFMKEGGGFGGQGKDGPPGGGKGFGKKDKGGFGPKGGFGGPPGFGGPTQPGQLFSPFVQDMLKFSEDQKKQLADIQKEVDARLDKILTEDQKKQLKEAGNRGPGGFGRPPGGPGGPRGPGGPDEPKRP